MRSQHAALVKPAVLLNKSVFGSQLTWQFAGLEPGPVRAGAAGAEAVPGHGAERRAEGGPGRGPVLALRGHALRRPDGGGQTEGEAAAEGVAHVAQKVVYRAVNQTPQSRVLGALVNAADQAWYARI